MEILFVLRKSRYSKLNEATIYCRITLNSKRAGGDFSTFIKVNPEKWDSKAQVIVSRSPEARADNETLANIRITLKEIYNDLQRKQKPLSADIVKREYLKGSIPAVTFLEAFRELIEQKKAKKQKLNTIRSNESRYNNIERYLTATGYTQLLPEEFDEKIADRLEVWLRTNLDKCCHNHAMKHLQLVKQTLKYCTRQKYISNNPLQYLELQFEKAGLPVFLTNEELQKLETYQFVSKPLGKVVDIFIFSCYTGFANIDYMTFHPDEHLQKDTNMDWIYKDRVKSGETAILPFFEKARAILKKYDGNLPKMTLQSYNRLIKEAAAVVGIKKNLTTHTARKTAATLWLNGGVPEETVARMLGHNSTKQLKIYARVQTKKIAEDTKVLGK